jgi:hypothetical protein
VRRLLPLCNLRAVAGKKHGRASENLKDSQAICGSEIPPCSPQRADIKEPCLYLYRIRNIQKQSLCQSPQSPHAASQNIETSRLTADRRKYSFPVFNQYHKCSYQSVRKTRRFGAASGLMNLRYKRTRIYRLRNLLRNGIELEAPPFRIAPVGFNLRQRFEQTGFLLRSWSL